MNKITNKVYDELSFEIDEWLLEELEITIDASKNLEIMNIIFNKLGLEKE